MLYELLAPSKRPKLDINKINSWRYYLYENNRKKDSWDLAESKEAKHIARRVFNFVEKATTRT